MSESGSIRALSLRDFVAFAEKNVQTRKIGELFFFFFHSNAIYLQKKSIPVYFEMHITAVERGANFVSIGMQ